MIESENSLRWKLQTAAKDVGIDAVTLSEHLLNMPLFYVMSGSSKPFLHHYGKGGLAQHTLEVVMLCLEVRKQFPQYEIDKTELFLASLYHDSGKLYDYFPVGEDYKDWLPTPHKRYIHHLSRSAIIWTQAVTDNNPCLFLRYHEPVLHAILSHHCTREAGSPVAPKSRVAWLVHFCDAISARLYDADTLDVMTGEIK